jgi:hypothetical protein
MWVEVRKFFAFALGAPPYFVAIRMAVGIDIMGIKVVSTYSSCD